MVTVAQALRRHADQFLEQRGDKATAAQRKTLAAILACRTGALGSVLHGCAACSRRHWIGRSCGNRHCPNCQQGKTAEWTRRELARLVPAHYFLVTFTVPEAFRRFALAHPEIAYAAMFRASASAVRTLATNPRHLGATELGFFSVLHTWGRDLNYHPHIHMVIPGGGLDAASNWRSTPENFFLPTRPLARLFRGAMRAELVKAGVIDQTEDSLWRRDWVIDCRPVGDGSSAIKYLAPYVFRTAIGDRRVVACTENTVTFRYKKSGTRRWRTMTLADDDAGRRRVRPPVHAARAAGGLAESAALRVPGGQLPHRAG